MYPGLAPQARRQAVRRMQDAIARAHASVATAAGRDVAPAATVRPDRALPPATPVAQLEARTYDEGLRAGRQARLRKELPSAYQRVGLDEFARGFRDGYYGHRPRLQLTDPPEGRAVVPPGIASRPSS